MIYLQKYDTRKFEKEEEALSREFSKRGLEIRPFYEKEVLRNRIKFTKDDFVAGNITVMHNVFKQLGIEIPETHDYPDILKSYLKRKIWSGKLKDVLKPIEEDYSSDIFIKPKERLKRFTGFVVKDISSLYQLGNISKKNQESIDVFYKKKQKQEKIFYI